MTQSNAIRRDWLGTQDFAVESEDVMQAAKVAADSKFGFGSLNNLTRVRPCAPSVPAVLARTAQSAV